MAEQRLVNLFEGLSGAIGALTNTVTAQGVGTKIEVYSGEPKGFKDWLKSIEKYALLTNADGPQTKRIAYQASKGAVSDFIHRYIQANPNNTWDQLKNELAARFSEIQDSQHAFTMLRQTKQKSGETVQIYAERLFSLAQEAFASQQGGLAAVENQMIGFFVDGLMYDYLKMKILRENPNTFQAAVTVAMNEQNLRKRFDLRSTGNPSPRKEEPMEIGHLRPRTCYNCHRQGHIKKNCPKLKGTYHQKGYVNMVGEQRQRANYQSNFRGNRDRQQMLCFHCHSPGHFKRECPQLQPKGQNQEN